MALSVLDFSWASGYIEHVVPFILKAWPIKWSADYQQIHLRDYLSWVRSKKNNENADILWTAEAKTLLKKLS